MIKSGSFKKPLIAISLTGNEIELFKSFLISLPSTESLELIIIFRSKNFKTFINSFKNLNALNLKVNPDHFEVQKNEHLFVSDIQQNFKICIPVNENLKTYTFKFNEFEEQFLQLPFQKKVYINFNQAIGFSSYGFLKYSKNDICFLSNKPNCILTPSHQVKPSKIFNLVQQYWNHNDVRKQNSVIQKLNQESIDFFNDFLDIICLVNDKNEFISVSKAAEKI